MPSPASPRHDEIRTERLLLRHWRPDDRPPFAALNADPAVMEHFPAPQDRATSDASVDRFEQRLTEHGWGFWALERLDTGEFIGFTGLNPVPDDLPVAPGIEVGWRLAHAHWGHGFAPEAAVAALRVAFGSLHAPEVVSFTSHANDRSQSVMRKIGLRRRPEADFDHPRFPDWPGRRHVVYAITAGQWREGARDSAPGAGTVGS
ncbi:MAG: GNAT family N-acetyltransferase [Angustibacter sp.]